LLEKEPDGGRFYNASVLVSPAGRLLARDRKVYLHLGERDTLSPGAT
jgi:predicted amidohydrolase